jgi:hypothetical protein
MKLVQRLLKVRFKGKITVFKSLMLARIFLRPAGICIFWVNSSLPPGAL